MSDQGRDPKNAPGPFYVLKDSCISCGAPPAEAPGLMTLDDDVGCYFHRQPETPSEVNDAIRALFVSCIEVHRYGGTDPVIRRRLAELGYAHLCDHPLEGHPVVVRNHIRFSLHDGDEAIEVARQLLSVLAASSKEGKCTKALAGNAQRAAFAYTHSEKYGTPRGYTIERVRSSVPSGPSTVYRDPSKATDWLLVTDGPQTPIGLHEILIKDGAVDIRWFSRDEWNSRAPGAELPY